MIMLRERLENSNETFRIKLEHFSLLTDNYIYIYYK